MREKRRRAPKKYIKLAGGERDVGGRAGGRVPGCLTNPAKKLLELLFRKKIIAALGEELVDPRMESHLLDPKFILGLDKNPGVGVADLLAVDRCTPRQFCWQNTRELYSSR